MREIKFRAFDTKTKTMLNDYSSNNVLDGGIRTPVFHGTSHLLTAQWELMQYTGTKDKNEKEIYEGDIVVFKNVAKKGIIEFGQYSHSFVDNYEYGNGFYINTKDEPIGLIYDTAKRIEVIGNIYENII